MKPLELLQAAQRARKNAYTPYSNFRVGAALLTKDGRVFLGANVENSSLGATICAERSALVSAVSSGARSFEAIAVAGAPGGKEAAAPCPPCGICLQFMSEFCGPEFPVYLADGQGGARKYMLKELFPHAFLNTNMQK
ncbi:MULTISPECIES: cytidine deaminase [Caproicibacterium]|jgi:cytidine deaminase|uniref:Cytidine deaminase n=1 Tax=Caproicibacterium lactatifermentans TaxID=2666138 RepID=A0A859DPP9_9FIRM|nr:cytidine deaminase [Caproicibacterium lactatifermentans]ARP50501.1 cytidine deaminase [Ruminococcaceae bacterium CPB6]MDD4808128.1 cytidine deaminase [Oscillospiraceae bacterium]QKN23780.1 cytidine deaminase [Caproicibacterium lactatifermentans]QKO29584.1 cytidine deaminase [Caproicibacterium lactatifermentans]